MNITLLQPAGLVRSPAFSHVAVVPAGAATIYVGGQNGVDTSGSVVSSDVADQSARAIDNVAVALEAAGAIAPRLARAGAPPLVTAARVVGLGVPGALIEVSAIAAVVPR